ncbi:MAG: serine/threonine protein kinase [Pseudanabaena sp.]|nr:MAG: serine/threonine protein kinase [Pseudanabaena sp.]
MSNCLCLACDRANSITTKFCTQCGAKLQIQERYRALKVIGQGGFGKTFLAQDESKPSQPRCVIKQFAFETINPNASQGTLDVAIRLFEQEAKRLDDLGKHPQIPELLSFTIHEGKQYLIQEFIDGETLEQELARVGAFSEQQVRDVLVEVLQILEFVHSKSVIHRDISPDNIIRRRSDQKLVLVDFGAAKHATATLLAKTGTGIGKPSYGAPEQMLGKSVFQSDLFGLGVTCLHLLTNVEPFTLYDVLENEYQWQQFLNGKVVSNEFGKLLDRLTAYRVKERPNSVTDILQGFNIGQKTSTAVNNSSGAYSFKGEDLQAEHRVSIPSAIPNKQVTKTTSSVSEFKFTYVKTRIVSSGFLGLGTRVELERQHAKTGYIRENLGNGVTIDLVRIPAGKFMMGSNEHDRGKPIHEVTLQEFWMGKYVMTQKQWQAVMGNNPAYFKGDNLPVERVSWSDARDSCEKVSKSTGKNFRLPTEAEWEYACRAGTNTFFHFGEVITPDLVNYDGKSSDRSNSEKVVYRKHTVNVNAFEPNKWGVYQMHGNVWEWCLDDWNDDYSKKPLHFKHHGNESWGNLNINKNDDRDHTLRGGSWLVIAKGCRSANRYRSIADNRLHTIGFRVVV